MCAFGCRHSALIRTTTGGYCSRTGTKQRIENCDEESRGHGDVLDHRLAGLSVSPKCVAPEVRPSKAKRRRKPSTLRIQVTVALQKTENKHENIRFFFLNAMRVHLVWCTQCDCNDEDTHKKKIKFKCGKKNKRKFFNFMEMILNYASFGVALFSVHTKEEVPLYLNDVHNLRWCI